MKRKGKFFVFLASLGLVLTGCGVDAPNQPEFTNNFPGYTEPEEEYEEAQMSDFERQTREIYRQYVANGGTMTYEQWLASIKGEKGDKGDPGTPGQNGRDGQTPYIGDNGHWWIGTTDTGVSAKGEAYGEDGLTPYIGDNYNWWIGEIDTGVTAVGRDGVDGSDGEDGLTPTIGLNGNWWIGDQDTGVKAQGNQGEPGIGILAVAYNGEGELVVTFDNGQAVNLGVVAQSTHVHDYECETLSATCTTDGYFKFTCTTCGHVEIVVTRAQGHLFDSWREKIPATCSSEGVKSRRCTLCGYEETENVPSHDHIVSKNCTYDANKHWHYCTECGVVFNEDSHHFNNNTCTVCSYTKSDALSSEGLLFGLNDDGASYGLISYGTCTNTVIDIPSSYNGYPVTKIASGAFKGTAITSVTMPNTIVEIGIDAFRETTSLVSIVLSNNITEIPDYCFCYSGLSQINVPYGVKVIGNNAFYYCSNLSTVILSNSVKMIEGSAFQYTAISSIVIPSSVQYLYGSSFSYCYNLSNITLNYGIKSLGYYAFAATKIESIVLPSSLHYIGWQCFAYCDYLTSIIFEQPDGWYSGSDKIYKEVLGSPELAANYLKNYEYEMSCNLTTEYMAFNTDKIILSISTSFKIYTRVYPETAIFTLEYETSDESIAIVTQEGVVIGVGIGETSILVKAGGLVQEIPVIVS